MSMETKHPAGHSGAGPNGDRYERRDANVNTLLKLGFWLAVVVMVSLFLMRWLFVEYEKEQPLGPTVSPLVQSENVAAPSPQLQAKPRQDLQEYCSDEEKKLDTYAWVDRGAGVVRLPIDRSMDLLLQRGLPTRPADQTSAAAASSELPPETTAVPPTGDFEGQCGYVVSQREAEKPKENAKE
jgi:hypothetical protein